MSWDGIVCQNCNCSNKVLEQIQSFGDCGCSSQNYRKLQIGITKLTKIACLAVSWSDRANSLIRWSFLCTSLPSSLGTLFVICQALCLKVDEISQIHCKGCVTFAYCEVTVFGSVNKCFSLELHLLNWNYIFRSRVILSDSISYATLCCSLHSLYDFSRR